MLVNLNSIAINNLRIIQDLKGPPDQWELIINGNKLELNTDENYDRVFNLNELEYPIYFSFHQLFNSIRFSSLYKINGYKTSFLIHLMDDVIEKLYDTFDELENESDNENDKDENIILNILDDVDDKFIVLRDRNQTCSFCKLFETMNDYLDSISERFLECGKYLYITYPQSTNEVIEKVNTETGEENPNLIYDDDETKLD